jgi:hypothetical protein
MKTFSKYLESREDMTNMVIKPGEGLGDTSQSEMNPDDALTRMTKMAAQDHHQELLDFFGDLARRDGRIKQELETYKKDTASGLHKRKPPKPHLPSIGGDDDRDEVVPSSADTSGGLESGEGEGE